MAEQQQNKATGGIELRHRLLEANARVEGMWPFPTSPAPEWLLEALEDGAESDLPVEVHALLTGWGESERADLFTGQGSADDAFGSLCDEAFFSRVAGWLGLVSVPVFKSDNGKSASFSWGYYRSRIVWGATADDVLSAAAQLGEDMFRAALAKVTSA